MSANSGRVGYPVPITAEVIAGKDTAGRVVILALADDGTLSVSVSSSGAAIQDGVSAAIKATVKNYTNSKPLAVINVDTNGDPTGGAAVSIADGADVALGTTTDAAIVTSSNGTVIGFLRGLMRLVAQVLDYDTGAGTATTPLVGLALPASGGPVAGGTSTNPIRTDPTGTTPQPVTFSVATSGGTSGYHKLSAANNNAVVIKASAGQVFGIHAFNLAAYPVYIKLYDKATTPAPGSDAVIRTIAVQAGQRADDVISAGLPFAAGISIAIVKNISETDNTSVAAADVVVDVDYK